MQTDPADATSPKPRSSSRETPIRPIDFTGEYWVPGRSGERIEADHRERYTFACKYVSKKSVLDIACGFGYAGPLLLRAGAEDYDGVDLQRELVDNANETYGSAHLCYYQGDIRTFSPGKRYDVVTCFETIEHVREYRDALLNLHRLLKPHGLLLISSPNRPVTSPEARSISDTPSNRYHAQEFTIQELKAALTSAGFVVNADGVYGQRMSLIVAKNSHIRRLLFAVFGDPSENSSPKVARLGKRTPRYFLIIARKQGSEANSA